MSGKACAIPRQFFLVSQPVHDYLTTLVEKICKENGREWGYIHAHWATASTKATTALETPQATMNEKKCDQRTYNKFVESEYIFSANTVHLYT